MKKVSKTEYTRVTHLFLCEWIVGAEASAGEECLTEDGQEKDEEEGHQSHR